MGWKGGRPREAAPIVQGTMAEPAVQVPKEDHCLVETQVKSLTFVLLKNYGKNHSIMIKNI